MGALGRPVVRGDALFERNVAAALELAPVWIESRGDERICVAVLDGPVDRSHPCFYGAMLSTLPTLVPADADDGPASRHGTHVASIIFGQPGSAVAGVAPHCRGIILPVFASGSQDSLVLCSQLDLARAILQAVDHGAHIINISGGQLTPSGNAEPLLERAIQTCAEKNILIVAAAGNDGCECLHVPAAVAPVLSVGAMAADGTPLDTSNWGPNYRTQGVLAPGQNIFGALPGGGGVVKSGTSFATPLVSGLAALLLSIQLKRGEKPNPHAVRAALIKSALPCDPDETPDCRRFLAGRVNPAGALNLVLEGGVNMSEAITIEPGAATTVSPTESPADAIPPVVALPARDLPAAPRIEAAVYASEAKASSAGATAAAVPSLDLKAIPPSPGQVTPSDCGCGGGATCTCGVGKPAQLVYALGKLGYDFGTEARRDSFVQAMPGDSASPGIPPNPHDPQKMADYLAANPFEAESAIWTLNLDVTPVYAIVPSGPFAAMAYERLREAFVGQLSRGVELVSVPGIISGAARLLSGQVVPVIVPAVRGLFSWATQPLIDSMLGARPKAAADRAAYDKRVAGLGNFLNRVYYDLRNLGLTAEERALNYSATNAFQVRQVLESAAHGDLELDTINVRKSPVCRPDSDCYDIELGFFDPRNTNVANKVYRFTVDVSDVIPVTIGDVRVWSKRA